jgi:DNA-binding response OmpR family regulator
MQERRYGGRREFGSDADMIASAREGHDHGTSVLVVDDEPSNSDMLARRLQRQHYRVDVVNSGQEALERLKHNAYDVTLLDVMMPGLDGFAVLDRVRSSGRHKDIPIIMVTAVCDASEIVRAFQAGADDYVTKPINFPILNARLRSQVLKHQARERLRASILRQGCEALIHFVEYQARLLRLAAKRALTSEERARLAERARELDLDAFRGELAAVERPDAATE